MEKSVILKIFLSLCLIVFLLGACDCGDDDDDDDHIPVDDDDDDTADDDDTTDDDDDDTVDDDMLDDDTVGPENIELVDGGGIAGYGRNIAVAPDGTRYVTAINARDLWLFSAASGKSWEKTKLSWGASLPLVGVNAAGVTTIVFRELEGPLFLLHNEQGDWEKEFVFAAEDNEDIVDYDFALDAQGNVWVGVYTDTGRVIVAVREDGQWQTHQAYDHYDYETRGIRLAVDDQGIAHMVIDCGVYLTGAGESWSAEYVPYALFPRYVDLALDDAGRPHIVSEMTYGYFTYVTGWWDIVKDGDQWTRDQVWAEWNVTVPWVFAVDSGDDGNPVLALKDSAYRLRTYEYDGGEWALGSISDDAIHAKNLALDVVADEVHLSYNDNEAKSLNYAMVDGDNWTETTLDSMAILDDERARPTILLDDGGDVHLIYLCLDEQKYSLRHAYRTAKGWMIEHVADADLHSSHAAALDASGNPVVAFMRDDGDGYDFWITRKVSDVWIEERIYEGDYYRGVNLHLDALGHAHLCGCDGDYSNGDLIYLTDAGGEWAAEIVDADIDYTETCDILLDAEGAPVIAYGKSTDLLLRWQFYLVRKQGEAWTTIFDDPTYYAGEKPSLLLDADGYLHAAYEVWLAHDKFRLRYTTDRSGEWATILVDEPLANVAQPSLALDGEGQVHVVYLNFGKGNLKHAWPDGDAWAYEILDPVGAVGWHPSALIDGDGVLHVGYTGHQALWYLHQDLND